MNPVSRRRGRLVFITASAVVLAVAAAATVGLRSNNGGQANAAPPAAPPAMPVAVATVAASEVTTWDEFSGRLEAIERVEVRSRVAGQVKSTHFREGALVKAGDLLVSIDPAPYAAEVDRADAAVIAAQARVSHSKSERTGARTALVGRTRHRATGTRRTHQHAA